MNIQTKITILLLLLTLLFVAGVSLMTKYETRREELLLTSKIFEKNTLYDKIIRLEEASLHVFAYEFSNRDAMTEFVRSEGRGEYALYLQNMLHSFNVTAAWIYDTEFRPVCTVGTDKTGNDTLPPVDDTFFTAVLSLRSFCHFFVETADGLMEIRTAPIQPARDTERRTAPAGYLLAGRLWSSAYVNNLAQLTESTIRLLPMEGSRQLQSRYDQAHGVITFSRIARGWDKKPLRRIEVTTRTPITEQLHRSSRNQQVLLVAFVVFILVFLSVFLIAWVNIPLKRISQSLNAEDPSHLSKLKKAPTEFGNLARLILRFFYQKAELTREILERQKAEAALRLALQESQRSESETTALLQASRALLKHHDFRNASNAILASCTSLSNATDGLIVEIISDSSGKQSLRLPAGTVQLEGIFDQVCTQGVPVFSNGASAETAAILFPTASAPVENVLCAPLTMHGEKVALLVLVNKPGGFNDNDSRMATAFCELASVALLNSKTLESLESSEERFRSVVQTAGDAIISVNSRGFVMFWNRAAQAIFGYTEQEAVGMPAVVLLPERCRKEYSGTLALLDDTTPLFELDPKPVEMTGLRNDGREFPIELSQAMWKTGEGVFFTAIVRDISARKQAEERLRRSEKRFRDIVTHSLTGICIVQNRRIVFKNEECERLIGGISKFFSFEDDFSIHADDRSAVETFYQDLTTGNHAVQDVNFRFYPGTRTGEKTDMVWVNCRGTVIDYQGEPALYVTMMDITRFMELEEMVRIQDKMSSLGRIAAGIAHEIRNPLTGINSYLYTLQQALEEAGQDSAAATVSIDAIQAASNKIESVIKRVMDFSKPSRPKLARVDINRAIQEAVHLSTVTLRQNGIHLTTALAESLPACYADFHMLEQVLLNLITNAVQAMHGWKGDKLLEIETCADADAVKIVVSDSGPGVSENNSLKIFDPFYTTKAEGSGIGLSLSHRIVSDHGGTMKVARSKWHGASFTVVLPLSGRTGALHLTANAQPEDS